MNDRGMCECCDTNKAHQTFTATSKLLSDEGSYEAGDKWHNRGWIYLCKECSTEMFSRIDEMTKMGFKEDKQ
jgi:hypothetical protein